MAKVPFTKLSLKVNSDVVNLTYNEQTIEVKQYLPVNDKLILISKVINQAADLNNFANPVKMDIYFNLELIQAYTNITFTDKQKEDPCKLYDAFESSGLMAQIKQAIPQVELDNLYYNTMRCNDAVYAYKNSVMGIVDTITTDYESLNFDATKIQKALGDPENMKLLKDVLAKLG